MEAGRCAELVKGLWKLGGDGIMEEGSCLLFLCFWQAPGIAG